MNCHEVVAHDWDSGTAHVFDEFAEPFDHLVSVRCAPFDVFVKTRGRFDHLEIESAIANDCFRCIRCMKSQAGGSPGRSGNPGHCSGDTGLLGECHIGRALLPEDIRHRQ